MVIILSELHGGWLDQWVGSRSRRRGQEVRRCPNGSGRVTIFVGRVCNNNNNKTILKLAWIFVDPKSSVKILPQNCSRYRPHGQINQHARTVMKTRPPSSKMIRARQSVERSLIQQCVRPVDGPPQDSTALCRWWRPPVAFSLEVAAHVGDVGHRSPPIYQVWTS